MYRVACDGYETVENNAETKIIPEDVTVTISPATATGKSGSSCLKFTVTVDGLAESDKSIYLRYSIECNRDEEDKHIEIENITVCISINKIKELYALPKSFAAALNRRLLGLL